MHRTDEIKPFPADSAARKTDIFAAIRRRLHYVKTHKHKLFWWWIAYQCVKGTLTTSLIWVPLLYSWLIYGR